MPCKVWHFPLTFSSFPRLFVSFQYCYYFRSAATFSPVCFCIIWRTNEIEPDDDYTMARQSLVNRLVACSFIVSFFTFRLLFVEVSYHWLIVHSNDFHVFANKCRFYRCFRWWKKNAHTTDLVSLFKVGTISFLCGTQNQIGFIYFGFLWENLKFWTFWTIFR